MNLKDKKIAIIGLGYVGLPLAVEFGKNYPVVGFDINQKRISELSSGEDKTLEVMPAELALAKNLKFSADPASQAHSWQGSCGCCIQAEVQGQDQAAGQGRGQARVQGQGQV
jgi:UDP-N-acetyl-D-mannosaminuronate dehydrogenase